MMVVIQSVILSSDCHCYSTTGIKLAKKSSVQPQPQTLQPALSDTIVKTNFMNLLYNGKKCLTLYLNA